jgi:hypothetical protein
MDSGNSEKRIQIRNFLEYMSKKYALLNSTGQTTNMETTHRNIESKMQQETEPFETSGGDTMEGRSINPNKGT